MLTTEQNTSDLNRARPEYLICKHLSRNDIYISAKCAKSPYFV